MKISVDLVKSMLCFKNKEMIFWAEKKITKLISVNISLQSYPPYCFLCPSSPSNSTIALMFVILKCQWYLIWISHVISIPYFKCMGEVIWGINFIVKNIRMGSNKIILRHLLSKRYGEWTCELPLIYIKYLFYNLG